MYCIYPQNLIFFSNYLQNIYEQPVSLKQNVRWNKMVFLYKTITVWVLLVLVELTIKGNYVLRVQ